ncbi:MAG: electron transfer flavoprotein subunit beta/FixA family protein [Proteobacteria bacterium]|nr:electron transfer flavoprotein subunit beta/FixA family protein [Pseudomonadota bacterium]MBU4275583.1 electron transfer flavoprotein subunit beta/FixA family protein [Pseudomonadota bacterium]MBU4382860.1 electron transfer flavoprotein subunit beta/FixA family protein [Pseudomonadota bacterium]MBU4606242.1 electron transfer flavoprotein subunit beta/FixA family protein [Pseudomonadota bacterium]MCG2765375.1 electron transfer flavoprotein subunit beta/FixA family protein [Desulfarculaceae ba
MRVLVCLKQVWEPESLFDLQGAELRPRPPLRRKISSYDELALEEALRLKDRLPEARVTALSVGPATVVDALRRALGMGADQVVHILAPEQPPPRPSTLAAWIAAWAREQGFDLILAGVMSEDTMQGAVGPMLAAKLGMPAVTSVVRLEAGSGSLEVEREMEGGRRQRLAVQLPALVTIQSGPNQPRYPTLSNLLRAKKTTPFTLEATGLAAPIEREKVLAMAPPEKLRTGLVLEGDTAQKAERLLAILRERALL